MLGHGSTFTLWLPAADLSSAGEEESATARSERAGLPGKGWRVHGLAEIRHALRQEIDDILEEYTATLRADDTVPRAAGMGQVQLEDHAITLPADLAQSLVLEESAGPDAAALMGDGTAIQRVVSEMHGARRFAQGCTEAEVRRDHQVLTTVVANAVIARVAQRAGDVSEGLTVLAHWEARSEECSIAAYQRARAMMSGEASRG